jgi:hypothetical protein
MSLPSPSKLKIFSPNQNLLCNDEHTIEMGPRFQSINQALAGPPKAQTFETPIITPPISSWQDWSNGYTLPRGIDASTNFDLYHSGYATTTHIPAPTSFVPPTRQLMYSNVPQIPQHQTQHQTQPSSSMNTISQPEIETYRATPGDVLDTAEYNPSQLLKYNIPSNIPAGKCMKTDQMSEYNKRLFTNTIEPNVFSRSEIAEPIPWNIGISFQQQNEPTTRTVNEAGEVMYVYRDPRIKPIETQVHIKDPEGPTNNTVYDPRSYGYGPSYRSYTDNMGRTRFYYDDIDSVRVPNYLVRSKIDHLPWAESYGPMFSQPSVHNNRQMVDLQYINDTSGFREQLQQQYMKKVNNQVMWQRRMAPLQTAGQVNGIKRI